MILESVKSRLTISVRQLKRPSELVRKKIES